MLKTFPFSTFTICKIFLFQYGKPVDIIIRSVFQHFTSHSSLESHAKLFHNSSWGGVWTHAQAGYLEHSKCFKAELQHFSRSLCCIAHAPEVLINIIWYFRVIMQAADIYQPDISYICIAVPDKYRKFICLPCADIVFYKAEPFLCIFFWKSRVFLTIIKLNI